MLRRVISRASGAFRVQMKTPMSALRLAESASGASGGACRWPRRREVRHDERDNLALYVVERMQVEVARAVGDGQRREGLPLLGFPPYLAKTRTLGSAASPSSRASIPICTF